MKKILWCGGSHMANCKNLIQSLDIFAGIENTFYVTGGTEIKKWCINGKGRYKINGTTVGGNGYAPKIFHDLAAYDQIVFISQMVSIQHYAQGDSPLSKSLLQKLFPVDNDNFLIHVPYGKKWIFNEPLSLFPKLALGKCCLAVDPVSNYNETKRVPVNVKISFKDMVREFCYRNDIKVMFQPDETLDDDLTTKMIYRRKPDDYIHMNDDFWRLYLLESIVPALVSKKLIT